MKIIIPLNLEVYEEAGEGRWVETRVECGLPFEPQLGDTLDLDWRDEDGKVINHDRFRTMKIVRRKILLDSHESTMRVYVRPAGDIPKE